MVYFTGLASAPFGVGFCVWCEMAVQLTQCSKVPPCHIAGAPKWALNCVGGQCARLPAKITWSLD